MKTMHGFQVTAAILLAAAISSAQMCRAEKPISEGQQDAGQREKHVAEMAALALPINELEEGQEANQKVMLEVVAADAQVVKSKPYTADTTTEIVQTLADGNHITHRNVSKFYRDSEGRTRREQTFGNVDPENPSPHEVKVFIDDPVTKLAFVLDPASKSVDKMQQSRKLLDEHNAEDDGTRIMLKSVKDDEEGEKSPSVRMLVKFRDEHSGDPNTVVSVIEDQKRDVQSEDLGTKTIEGVECKGTRKTITIPAGAIGNEKPISTVRETWFAPAIEAVVQSTTDDPRFGKTTYQLSNVQLSEPARSLFDPPADFKISVRK